jgi:hypothetical protein
MDATALPFIALATAFGLLIFTLRPGHGGRLHLHGWKELADGGLSLSGQ